MSNSEAKPRFNERDVEAVVNLFQNAIRIMLDDSKRQGSVVRLPARGKLLATGDLHDNPGHFATTVKLAKLSTSVDNHVVLHELIHGDRLVNGLDLSYRMLVKVALLMESHPGQVHVVLANHELSQMAGHPVSKGGSDMTANFDAGLEWVFGDSWESVADALREFILALPLAVITENGICCAHSLPGPSQMSRFDIDIINRTLTKEDYAPLVGSAWMMVWGRGHTSEQMENIAQEWGISLFCLGHAFVENGIEIGGPRTILLNTDHARATVLSIPLDEEAMSVEVAMFSAIPIAALGEAY